jgi:chemotaxis protein methyltransferase CheR
VARHYSDYKPIMRLLSARTGLTFQRLQRTCVVIGIDRAMAQANVSDCHRYVQLLAHDQRAFDSLVNELTIGETYFFREPMQFEFIRRTVLGDRRERSPREPIHIWSAGCASGEEPYSLAILCEQEQLSSRVQIVATDISSAALAKAREGKYTSWSLRGENAEAAKPYLHYKNGLYAVDDRLRCQVQFKYLNLALDKPDYAIDGIDGMDLILCRNVLIYFDKSTIATVARKLYDALAPNGWLVLGSSDPGLCKLAPFHTLVVSSGVFYQRRNETIVEKRGHSRQSFLPQQVSPETTIRDERPSHKSKECCAVPAAYSFNRKAKGAEPKSACDDAGCDPKILLDARKALQNGHYRYACELTAKRLSSPAACVIHIEALANENVEQALEVCTDLSTRQPLCVELQYLHAILLLESNQYAEGVVAARRMLYLDRKSAMGHFVLGSLLNAKGDRDGARQAFRNSRDLCRRCPANEIVAYSDGQSAGCVAAAAQMQLDAIAAGTSVMKCK